MQIDLNFFSSILQISPKQLKELIEKKKKEFYNLIDDEAALLIILKEKGIKIDTSRIKIIDLFSGITVPTIYLCVEKRLNNNTFIVYDETAKAKLILDKEINLKEGEVFAGKNFKARKGKFIYLKGSSKDIYFDVPEEIAEKLLNTDPKSLGFVYEGVARIHNNYLLTDYFSLFKTNEKEEGEYFVKAIVKDYFANIFWKSNLDYEKVINDLRRLTLKKIS